MLYRRPLKGRFYLGISEADKGAAGRSSQTAANSAGVCTKYYVAANSRCWAVGLSPTDNQLLSSAGKVEVAPLGALS